jgi:DNA replication and repair protein RecF
LTLSPGVNLWVGENGQGKTNGLDALAVLASQRYPAGIPETEMVQWNQSWMDVRGQWQSDLGDLVSSRLAVELSPRRRRIREGPTVPLVQFSPGDLSLIQAGPAYRRGFLDQLAGILYPRYSQVLRAFERVVSQKNRGLKEGWADSALATFSDMVADSGTVIWNLRRDTLARLIPEILAVHRRLAGVDEVLIRLSQGGVDGEVLSESENVRRYIASRSKEERARAMALVGPHRDDLIIELNGHLAQKFASQGEQRTLALSLKLATYNLYREQFSARPLVLLDDVLSELDLERRQLLLQIIAQDGQQTVITDTELRSHGALRPLVYQVSGGVFQPWH